MASGADRISGLYDELLHHVLSFLPAHEAVRTCVLARRWRHPWKSPPRRCASPALSGAPTPRGSSTSSTLHNLLLLRDPMARLDSFELDRDFGCKAFLPANEAHVNMWFRHAAMCGPRALLALRTTRGIYRHGVDDDPQRLAGSPTSLSYPGTSQGWSLRRCMCTATRWISRAVQRCSISRWRTARLRGTSHPRS